jgi:hypothetical protein
MKPSGGGTTVTPIAPPAPLFPGITSGFRGAPGRELGKAGAQSLKDIISGADLKGIFSAIQDANQRQVKEDTASIKESFGASGLRYSSDLMKNLTDYQLQNQKQMTSQFAQLGLQNEQMQLGGLSLLENLATSFAPTQVVSQNPAGASPFSQLASAGEAAMMLFLMAG